MLVWIIGGILGAILVAILLVYFIGRNLPAEHVVTATLSLRQTPDVAWSLIADIANQPNWDKGVTRVELLPKRDGKECCRMHMGRNAFVLLTIRSEKPRALAREIIDDAKFFGGTWEYDITPTPDGVRIKLTEYGKVFPAIPRFMMKFVVDPAMYLKRHLNAIAAHFGEEPRLSDVGRLQ